MRNTMKVIVHKANIPMIKGESLTDFTGNLSKAAKEHTLAKLNISNKNGGGWLMEAYSDKVIMAAYNGDDPTKYYATSYKRNVDGSFAFGDLVEMERTSVWKPKGQSILKSKQDGVETEEGESCSDQKTDKNLWSGLV
jgi:hypothetical protein